MPRKRKKLDITKKVIAARARVVLAALQSGTLTHAQACKYGKWAQGWFHLDQLRQAGLLQQNTLHDTWGPTEKLVVLATLSRDGQLHQLEDGSWQWFPTPVLSIVAAEMAKSKLSEKRPFARIAGNRSAGSVSASI